MSDTSSTGSVAGHDRAAQAARPRAGRPAGSALRATTCRLPEDIGYRGPTACSAAGITYRQLDYWARTGLVEPTIRGAAGSGTQRLYCFRDILVLKVVKRLLDTGVSLQQIRTAVAAPARARRRRPGPDHPDERRRQRLRVHLRRRGHRPGAGRPGRVRHRGRPGLARGRGLAGRAARRAQRRCRRRRRPADGVSDGLRAGPPFRLRPATSCRPVGRPARPADRRPQAAPVGAVDWVLLTIPRGRDLSGRCATSALEACRSAGRRRGNLPGTSQAARTARTRQLWSAATEGEPYAGRAPPYGFRPAGGPVTERANDPTGSADAGSPTSPSSLTSPSSVLDASLPFAAGTSARRRRTRPRCSRCSATPPWTTWSTPPCRPRCTATHRSRWTAGGPSTRCSTSCARWPRSNQVLVSMIGLGYHGTVTPPVIRRNVLENPAWYTAYTPYQPEISQGRLEALLNFQTVVADLTGLPMAGASLLDEGTAAAEAMTLARRTSKAPADAVFVVDADVLPQTLAVIGTRAEPLGIEVVVADLATDGLPERRRVRRAAAVPGGHRRRARPRSRCRRGQGARRPGRGGRRPAGPDPAALAGRARRRRRRRQHPAVRCPDGLRRTARGVHVGAAGPRAPDARPPGRGLEGRHRAPGVPAGAADPRAAHPSREGDQQHLHGAGPARRGRRHVRRLPRPRGAARDRPPGARLRGRPRRWAAGGRRRGACTTRSSTPSWPVRRGARPRSSPPRWHAASTSGSSTPTGWASRPTRPRPGSTWPRCGRPSASTAPADR